MFDEKLKKAMQDLGLSQSQLSKMTGIGRSSICQYMAGKNVPTVARRVEIATALGLDPDYFADDGETVEPIILEKRLIPRLSVAEAAKAMGISKIALSNGLQDGVFPWGYAVRGSGEKYVYFINAKRFAEIEGITL